MSEYQYYEFRTIDQPLGERAQCDLRDISSRATITATSFANSYSWGDLKADPVQMLARWFDAFLHLTNWGTRWLAFRVPHGALSAELMAPYRSEVFSWRDHGQHTCLHFLLQDEDPGDWIDGEGQLGSLLPLREALAAGDLRCLYLAWLVAVQLGEIDDEEDEPPIPPGLRQMDAAHEAFAEFMQLDEDLLAVAAEASEALAPTEPTPEATQSWLASRDVREKDRWILRVLGGDGARLRWELRKLLRADLLVPQRATNSARNTGSLIDRAELRAEEREERLERERAARARREAERRAAARERHLDSLAGREDELWSEVDELIATRQPKAYDQVVVILADLRDLAVRSGAQDSWHRRLKALRAAHVRKTSLARRIDILER